MTNVAGQVLSFEPLGQSLDVTLTNLEEEPTHVLDKRMKGKGSWVDRAGTRL